MRIWTLGLLTGRGLRRPRLLNQFAPPPCCCLGQTQTARRVQAARAAGRAAAGQGRRARREPQSALAGRSCSGRGRCVGRCCGGCSCGCGCATATIVLSWLLWPHEYVLGQ